MFVPATLFAVPADPATRSSADAIGRVEETVDQAPLTEAGQIFRMDLNHADHPEGGYRVVDEVRVLGPPHTIGQLTGYERDDGRLEFGGCIRRCESAPLDPTDTGVTLTWSAVSRFVRDRDIRLPRSGTEHLGNSLRHLAAPAGISRSRGVPG